MKKYLSLLLALVMVLSLAACGGAPAEAPAETEAAAENAPATEAKAEKPVEIKIWFHGSNVQPAASEKVMAELNKYLVEKINVELVPTWGTWGDFDTTVPQAMQAGDDVDIYFTCNWSANEYNKYAKDGYFVKLDDMLEKYAPELVKTIPEGIWECAKTNGLEGVGIYAVPGLKDTATQNCWDVNVSLFKELGLEVPEKLDFFSDEFESYLAAAKEAKGADFYPLLIEPAVLERMVTHSSIVGGDLPNPNVLSYYYDGEHPATDMGSKIVNKFATPEFEAYSKRVYELGQKGYIAPQSMMQGTSNDYLNATRAAATYLIGTQVYAYGCEVEFAKTRGIEMKMIPETAPYMDATAGQGAMMGISATSKHPEKALEFLNLLNTDPVVMTFVNYGVEGFTYEKNEDGTINFLEARDQYSPWRNGVGNVRILPATADEGADYWERFAAYYDAAEVLPLGSFIMDKSELANEAGAIGNVAAQYAFNLCSGAVDPATELPKFLDELTAAGMDKFVESANAQLDAFLAK